MSHAPAQGRYRRGGRDDDRGVLLIIVALSLIAIMAIAAIVIDLGQARAAHRQDQQIADIGAMAAGFFLSGNGQSSAVANPRLACEAAVNSATTNQPAFTPSTSGAAACAGYPTDAQTCIGASPAMTGADVVLSGGGYTLTVRYPVSSSEITDATFNGAGVNDAATGQSEAQARCYRMRVTFQQSNATSFARVIGIDTTSTSGTAVVRGGLASTGSGVAALLSLERVGCGALQNSGQGAIIVSAPSSSQPGVIQADSAGQVGPCTTNNNAGGFVVYGTALPSGGPSIQVDAASGSIPGVIGIYSLSLGTPGRGGAVYPGGLSVQPTANANLATRQPADTKYNSSTNGNQIKTLHETAYPLANGSAPAGYSVLSGNQECNGNITDVTKLNAGKIFADCSTFSADLNIFVNATDFIVKGNIDIANNKVLSLPKVHNFFVRGCSVGGCGGSNTAAISVAGSLYVNTGETAIPSSFANGISCSLRTATQTPNWSQLATFSGSFAVTGQIRLCQTTVYLGVNSPTYTRQTVTNTGVAPESYPALAQCSATLPCPKDNVDTGAFISVTGGGAASDWTAPNQIVGRQPTTAEYATYPLEDLALWGETSSSSVELKGQGSNNTQGVYFLPNASAFFQGQGNSPITLNAQLFIRYLNISGQGLITLNPNAQDSIQTPVPGGYLLIR